MRREATDAVGLFDEDFFMFSEETDWLYRFRAAGWKVLFFPGAEVVHVGGASHGGRLYVENLRGHLRFLAKHRGPREAERARRLLLVVAAAARAGLPRRAAGARTGRASASWPPATSPALLAESVAVIEYLRLAVGTVLVLAAGLARRARARPAQRVSATLAWALAALFAAWSVVFVVHGTIWLALGGARARSAARRRPRRAARSRARCPARPQW